MKKYIPIFVLLIVIGLFGNQTLAYLTVQKRTTNIIDTATIDIELMNMTLNEEGEEVPLQTEIENILPGDTCSQRVYVKNCGEVDLYARVQLSSVIKDASGEEMQNTLEFNIDEENWKKDEDGWYRYLGIIKSGEMSLAPLFTEVHFPVGMDNSYVGSKSTITLQAQAVQAEHNEHENVLDIIGWPMQEGGAK